MYKGSGWYQMVPGDEDFGSWARYVYDARDYDEAINEFNEEFGEGHITLVHQDDATDPEFFINIAESELEDANYHSIGGIPTSIYEKVINKIALSNDDKLAFAKAIYESFKGL